MKKFTLTLLALLPLAFSATSQDTIFLGNLYNDNYFYYGPYEEFWTGDFPPMYYSGPNRGGEYAKNSIPLTH